MSDPSAGRYIEFSGECPECDQYIVVDAELVARTIYFKCPTCDEYLEVMV
jgi:predicted RNA-binding Zn-ribbon protein involved in translation (DUF1610 family)